MTTYISQENKVVCSEWSFTGLEQIAELCLELGAMFIWVSCLPGFHTEGAAMGGQRYLLSFWQANTVGAEGCKEFKDVYVF